MPFQITFHAADQILEVVYPADPTGADVADYLLRAKATIDTACGKRWFCLVDQRALTDSRASLVDKLALLNVYAVQRGMARSARVVASGKGAQTSELVGGAMTADVVRVFFSRPEALSWLRSLK